MVLGIVQSAEQAKPIDPATSSALSEESEISELWLVLEYSPKIGNFNVKYFRLLLVTSR